MEIVQDKRSQIFGVILFAMLVALVVVVLWRLYKTEENDIDAKCSITNVCKIGLVCDSVTSTCKVKKGYICKSDEQCQTRYTCKDKRCVDKLGITRALTMPATLPVASFPAVQNLNIAPDTSHTATSNYKSEVDERAVSSYSSNTTRRSDFSVRSGESSAADDLPDEVYSIPSEDSELPSKIVGDAKHAIIDITGFSTSTIYLTDKKEILKDDGHGEIMITSNINPEKIDRYGGYLYAVSDGVLYSLANSSFTRNNWQWERVSWCQIYDISHMSTTLDGNHIWIQSSDTGYLHDKKGKVVISAQTRGCIRKYGYDKNHFVDYFSHSSKAYISRNGRAETLDHIHAIALTKNGEPATVGRNERHLYFDVKIVNWIPTFICYNGRR